MANTRRGKKNIKGTNAVASTGATAVHVPTADGHHAVGIGDLRVLVVPDGKFWFVQGWEMDYASQGSSIEEAKQHFEDGLSATIQQHLRVYGSIKRLLAFTPSEVLVDALVDKASKVELYSQVSLHHIGPAIQQALPFDGISYLVSKEAA